MRKGATRRSVLDKDLEILAEILEQAKTSPEDAWTRVTELHRIQAHALDALTNGSATPREADRVSRDVRRVLREFNK
jgi:hypothetical protein